MNQGKLEVVKQEMVRVNIDILGISKLKWMGRVNLMQMNIESNTLGKNPLEEMEYHHSQQKSLKCSSWMQSQKWQNDLCFQGKSFNITVIQVYAPIINAEETDIEWFYGDLQDLLELTPKKISFALKGTGMQK